MRRSKREYLFSWIALGIIITGATLLLLLTGSENSSATGPLLLLLWAGTVSASVYLFIIASGRILKNNPVEQPSKEKKIRHIRQERNTTGKKEQFDIRGTAGKIVRRLSMNKPPKEWGHQLLQLLVTELEMMSGIFYYKNDQNIFESLSTYAYPHPTEPYTFTEGEGLTGQAVKNRQVTVFRSIPDNYRAVFSGLGSGKPSYLAIVPILVADEPVAVIEIAGFRWAEENLEQLFQIIARDLSDKISQPHPQGKTKEDEQ